MQNTKIEYTSDLRMPVVLPEMEQLLPPLSAEQFSLLECDILENGCYAPIVVNEDMVIIDGHNRFRICEKHGLPFQMLAFSFRDLLEAKRWALNTQRGRRNLSLWELGQIALKLKPELEAQAKSNQGSRTDLLVNSPKPYTPTDTRTEMARTVGIGEQTMGRITRLTENAPQVLKDALESKKVSVNCAWNILKAVEKMPPEEQETAAAEMVEAAQEVKRLDAEAERRGKIAGLFCKAYESGPFDPYGGKRSLLDGRHPHEARRNRGRRKRILRTGAGVPNYRRCSKNRDFAIEQSEIECYMMHLVCSKNAIKSVGRVSVQDTLPTFSERSRNLLLGEKIRGNQRAKTEGKSPTFGPQA